MTGQGPPSAEIGQRWQRARDGRAFVVVFVERRPAFLDYGPPRVQLRPAEAKNRKTTAWVNEPNLWRLYVPQPQHARLTPGHGPSQLVDGALVQAARGRTGEWFVTVFGSSAHSPAAARELADALRTAAGEAEFFQREDAAS